MIHGERTFLDLVSFTASLQEPIEELTFLNWEARKHSHLELKVHGQVNVQVIKKKRGRLKKGTETDKDFFSLCFLFYFLSIP